ncbi:hypothetical protein ACFL2T_02760 [Elusimicrobiota bacterium]
MSRRGRTRGSALIFALGIAALLAMVAGGLARMSWDRAKIYGDRRDGSVKRMAAASALDEIRTCLHGESYPPSVVCRGGWSGWSAYGSSSYRTIRNDDIGGHQIRLTAIWSNPAVAEKLDVEVSEL